MIELKEISCEEAQKLNSELRLSFWAIPIALSIALLLVTLISNWLLNAPWSVFWYSSGGLFAIFAVVRLIYGKPPELIEGTMKITRRAKVIDVAYMGNRPVLGNLKLDQHIVITLPPEPTPSGYHEHHTFTVYQMLGMSYYQQDGSLKNRRAHLIDREVEIEYLAESGTVLAFRELNPASKPPTLYLRWGNIQLTGNKTILSQNRVDFITLATDPYGNTGVFLRSDSVPDELFVPLYTKNLNRLEEYLFTLEGFSKSKYIQLKENPPTDEKLIWERRVKHGVSFKSVYAGERVSLFLGSIHVYRNNGHDESIRMQEVDYISIYSSCTDKPNTEFFIYLRSFQQSSISIQSRAEGFSKLESWINQLPDFDANQYVVNKATVGEQAKVIWLRLPVANARLLNENESPKAITGLERGIFVKNLDRWLDWGTFGDLSRLVPKKWLTIKKTRYPNPDARGYTYIIKKPEILGGLELTNLQSETPSWGVGGTFHPEWPVTSYWADVSFGNGGLDDFERLKLHFTQLIGTADGHSDPTIDGNDNIRAYWLFDRVTIKISTWKPYLLDVFQHSCRLDITYKANVDHFYTDNYTRGLVLHDQLRYLVLDGELSVVSDYTNHPNSRYTPNCLSELIQTEHQYIIWLDKKHAKLGIGNIQNAQVLDITEVAGLSLTGSYWRDHPRELQFHCVPKKQEPLNTNSFNYLGELNTHQGDRNWSLIREQMEDFFGMPCTYLEDRQYY